MKSGKYAFVFLCLLSLFSAVASSKEKRRENRLSAEALKVLEGAEKLEVLSLDPKEPRERSEKAPAETREELDKKFHNWKILGRTMVKDASVRKEVVVSLLKGMEDIDVGAKCFIPRHGLRATLGDKTVDVVIYFQCSRLSAYVGNNEKDEYLLVDGTAAPVISKILKKAGISVAP